MNNPELDPNTATAEPANLRFLRRLVTILTATMIAGVLVIVALIVMRFYAVPPDLPNTLDLPGNAKAVSFTQGPDWYAVVTDADDILIFDRVTGQLTQQIKISPKQE